MVGVGVGSEELVGAGVGVTGDISHSSGNTMSNGKSMKTQTVPLMPHRPGCLKGCHGGLRCMVDSS